MIEKRTEHARIHVLQAWVLDVRTRLQAASFVWREIPHDNGSVDFQFTELTSDELGQILRTVPLEAYAKRAIAAGSVAHLSLDELKELMSRKLSGGGA